jgi:hypothetical protein
VIGEAHTPYPVERLAMNTGQYDIVEPGPDGRLGPSFGAAHAANLAR